jgi:hypothetical protein
MPSPREKEPKRILAQSKGSVITWGLLSRQNIQDLFDNVLALVFIRPIADQ